MENFVTNKVKEITNYLNKQLKEIEKKQVEIQGGKYNVEEKIYKQSLIDIINEGLEIINEENLPYPSTVVHVHRELLIEDLQSGEPIYCLDDYGFYTPQQVLWDYIFAKDALIERDTNNFANQLLDYFNSCTPEQFPLRIELQFKPSSIMEERLLQLMKDGLYNDEDIEGGLEQVRMFFELLSCDTTQERYYKVCDLEYDKDNYTITGSAIIEDLEDLENYDEI